MIKKKIKKHLLIIGGTGFIGIHLAKYALKKGWNVSSLSKNKKKHKSVKGVNYIYIDITKKNQIMNRLKFNFTHVVNLSGYKSQRENKKEKNKIFKVNFLGLLNLVNFFKNKKIIKFVQIGSSSEYGNGHSPLNENKVCYPNSEYGLAKLKSTNYLLKMYKYKSFPVTILRIFNAYGPNQNTNFFIPQVIIGCLKNKSFAISKGEQIRDFIYIDDVVSAIFLTLNNTTTHGKILNIASGSILSLKNVVKIIRKIIKKGNPEFGKIAYKKNENMKVYCKIDNVKKKLKWKPKIKFVNGILKTINYYKKNI